MKAKYVLFNSLLVLALLVLPSCQPTSTSAGRKSIVVTYSILGSVVKDLAGDDADVTVIIPNGLDPHEFEPSAKDIEAINKADLVVENGLDLEEGMSKTLDAARQNGARFFTASDHIEIRHVGPDEQIHEHEHQEADHEEAGGHSHAAGAPDPHLWTDPLTMKSVAAALAPVLQNELGLDVAARAASLEDRLDQLNNQVTGILSVVPPDERKLVTGHASMGYFADRYDFKQVGVIIPSLSSQAEVSAADLAALKQAIEENRVRAVFTEVGTSPAVVKAIADETGAKVIELTSHALPAGGTYFTFMTDIAGTIAGALK